VGCVGIDESVVEQDLLSYLDLMSFNLIEWLAST